MSRPDITEFGARQSSSFGLTHFSIGDGYYESLVLDCEGNHVEITE